MTDEDMAAAVSRLAEIGGGIVAVERGKVVAECPLPIAGLLSDAPLAEVIEQSRACNDAAHTLGWSGATPFLTLVVPRALGDPEPEDHRPRARRRRPLRARPARSMSRVYANGWVVTMDDAPSSIARLGARRRRGDRRASAAARSRSPTNVSTSAAPSSRRVSSTRTTTCIRR